MADRNASLKVLFSTLKMAVATFSSRILGLVREQAMAAMFGASGLTDAFLVAYRIPNMLRDLFAEGAFSSAFVPVFTEERQKDEESAKRLLWSLFCLLGFVTLIISFLIILGAPEILKLIAPKFTQDVEKFDLTVTLIRIMSPFLTLVSIAALFMGALNSLKIFFLPAFAPVFFNISMIVCIFMLPPLLVSQGLPTIYSLAIGVLIGGFFQAAIQFPRVLKAGYGPTGPIKLISVQTKKVFSRVGIGVIGIAATQINILINTILATGTVVGAVSWLTYAFRLFQFPVGILGVSLAGSNLVHFSDAWKSNDEKLAKSYLSSAYFMSLLVMLPAAALMWPLADNAMNLVFQRGEFSSNDTAMSAIALRYYVIGLPFYGIYKIFAPTFYAIDRPKVPVFISVVAIVFNVIFCVALTPLYGFKILALGTSLSMLLNTLLQSIFLARFLKLSFGFFLNLRILKLILPTFVVFYSSNLLSERLYQPSSAILEKLMSFLAICFIVAILYAMFLLIFGEYQTLKSLLKKNKK